MEKVLNYAGTGVLAAAMVVTKMEKANGDVVGTRVHVAQVVTTTALMLFVQQFVGAKVNKSHMLSPTLKIILQVNRVVF